MKNDAQVKTGSRDAILVIAFAAFVAFAGVFTLPPLDRDEARFAEASVQMLESGDYIAIRFQDTERNKKPAGAYWLQAASVAVFSSPEVREIWAYRLPSVLGAILAALFTFAAARRLFGPKAGLIAGLLLAAAPAVAGEATIAKTDALLLACVAAAQWMFIEILSARLDGRNPLWRYIVAFWFAIGAGVLIKGPVILMIIGLTVAALCISRKIRAHLAATKPLAGVLILVLMILPWAYAINAATEGRFFTDAIGGDMLSKVGAAQESHGAPPGYYTILLFILFWPAAAIIPASLKRAIDQRSDWRVQFLLAWIVPSFAAFEFAATKLPHYTLPLYPSFAILAAHAATSGVALPKIAIKSGAVIYGVVGVLLATLMITIPIHFHQQNITVFASGAAAALAACSIFVASSFWRGKVYTGIYCAIVLGAFTAWALLGGILPNITALDVSRRLNEAVVEARLHPIKNGAPPVAITGYYEPSAVFLLGAKTRLESASAAARDLVSLPPRAVIVEARNEAEFKSALNEMHSQAEPLARVQGFNYSNGKEVDLTIYRMASGVDKE
ncbi:MAG: glycosyltransferase family 39 protein [Parvularculaceae bacterium]